MSPRATAVIVAVDRDDTAVLITLIAREHNKTAKISAAVREEENIHLLHQGGADSAILSSGATGRLLGFSTIEPHVVEVLEDLLSVGTGLDIREREVTTEVPDATDEPADEAAPAPLDVPEAEPVG